MCSDQIIDLYERHARDFDKDRNRHLQERRWLERFAQHLPAGAAILDIGCGMGEPIARHLLEQGFHVVGVDSSPTLVGMCRERFPDAEWIVGDMRALSLGRRFDGILAWDSLFHLTVTDQRQVFPRLAEHAHPGAALMFTAGPREGEAIGSYRGEPLYHASLDPQEYNALLTRYGFSVRDHLIEDPDCGGHTVWLAAFGTPPAFPTI